MYGTTLQSEILTITITMKVTNKRTSTFDWYSGISTRPKLIHEFAKRHWLALHKATDLCQGMEMLDGGALERIARQSHGIIADQLFERARGVSNSMLASIFAGKWVKALE
jgi:hypothetical protein